MATRLVLKIMSGPFEDPSRLTVRQARIQGGQALTVGRNRLSTDLGVCQDPMMSGTHFRVALEDPYCRLYDLESRNGTYLNGKRVIEAILTDTDEIRAGQTVFRVQVQDGAALSGTVVEFGAISPTDLEEVEEDEEDEDAIELEVSAVFDAVKARIRSRA